MTAGYLSECRFGFDLDVPEGERRMARDVAENYDRRQKIEAEDRGHRLGEVTETANRRIRELMGEEKLLSLRKRMRDERAAFRDLFQPPADRQDEYAALDARRRANVQAHFDSLGIDGAALKRIVAESAAAVEQVRPAIAAESGYAQWLHDGPTPHPPAIPTDDPHAWTPFRPPFPGWQMGFAPHNLSGFSITRTHHLDAAGGLVGHDLFLDNGDASDFDNGWGTVDTQIGINWRAPATGLVEVYVEARCARAHHRLHVVDEWGVSDSSTTQRNFLMAHVLHPNVTAPTFAEMSRFHWKTDVSGLIERDFLNQGGGYWARLFSNGPVLQGQTVHIRVGTRTEDGSITNDMEIYSGSFFRWFIGTVWVRTAP